MLKRRFTKRNWVAFMIANISELEKGNCELIAYGAWKHKYYNGISLVQLNDLYIHSEISAKKMMEIFERIKEKLKVLSSSYFSL